MSTYILGTDDPDDVRRFAAEVAPAVRELVEAERSAGAPGLVGRTRCRRPRRCGTPAPTRQPSRPAPAALGRPRSRRTGARRAPTPDDGVRLSRRRSRGTRHRPPGDPEPDDAAYTPAQQAVPQHLVDVHDHLRAELAQVRDVVDQVRRGHLAVGPRARSINTMTMRQNNWTLGAYCESYCRLVTGHHTLEDPASSRTCAAADPDAVAVIDRLEQEHHVIADVLEQVDQALVGLVGRRRRGREALDELQRAVDLLTDTLLSHLAYEERELLHPLARTASTADGERPETCCGRRPPAPPEGVWW